MESQNESTDAILVIQATTSPHTPLLGGTRRRRHSKALAAILSVALLFAVVFNYIHGKGNRVVVSTSRPVARGVPQGVSNKSFSLPPGGSYQPFRWSQEMLSWQRTSFHFQPNKNWMNDPNGPLFYKGWYHLFYQYNPESAVWGNIVWGHAVSKDLIHWDHLPIAMVPDHWYDANGVWTGSATVLPSGEVVMLYTGATQDLVQVQNLAFPADPSDPLLVKWAKYQGNPVLVPPPGIGVRDFRDPTTAWYEEGRWNIMIGSKVNTTGVAMVFDTEDFVHFRLVKREAHGVGGTGMWECVDLYPVCSSRGVDSSGGCADGGVMKHVLKTSLDDERKDYYAIGRYEAHVWTPDHPSLDAGIGLRYDYGTYYASKSFHDPVKSRRVNWGWISETDTESADLQKGWASLQAIPRTILLDNQTGTHLLQWPVEEVEMLRSEKSRFHKVVELQPGSLVHLDVGDANQLDIEGVFEVVEDEALGKAGGGSDVPYSCGGGAAQRGAFGPFGLLVLANLEFSEQTPIYFYIAKDAKGKFKTFFCADHLRSSQATDVRKETYGTMVPVLDSERLLMRILVDHSIVECFGQGGRACITSRVYPTKAIGAGAKLYLFNNATHAVVTASLQVWQMAQKGAAAAAAAHHPIWTSLLFLIFLFF